MSSRKAPGLMASGTTTANVKVTLKRADGKNPAKIYGKITAYGSISTTVNDLGVLFDVGQNNATKVMLENTIPLPTSTIENLPQYSHLSIKANLWLYDETQSPNLEIVDGTEDFPTKMTGDTTSTISGKYGEIEVKVTWGN